MRTCSVCKIPKNESNFSILKNGYYKSQCKECRNKRAIEIRASRKDGYYYLYYLPEEHYVGITNFVKQRIAKHKHLGKVVDNYEIICKFKFAVQAHLYETYLHCMGYNGFRP